MKNISKNNTQKILLLGFSVLATSGFAETFPGTTVTIGVPSQSSTGGTPGWSKNAYTVTWVKSSLGGPSTNWGAFERFGLSHGLCQNTAELNLPMIYPSGEMTKGDSEKYKNMKAILLTAVTTGTKVQVHYKGQYCWVDEVALCGDTSCNAYL